jgi:DNA-binding MarR family transcriptional regulator
MEQPKVRKGRRHDNASKAREKTARAERRLKLAKLNLDGWTQQEIAAELKIDRGTVCRELQALRAEWAAEHKAAQHEHVQRELVSLQRDEKDVRERLVAVASDEDEDKNAAKWHEVLLKIRDRRAKLLGLDAPTKIEAKTDTVVTERRLALEGLAPDAQQLASALAAQVYAPRAAVSAAIAATAPARTETVPGADGASG